MVDQDSSTNHATNQDVTEDAFLVYGRLPLALLILMSSVAWPLHRLTMHHVPRQFNFA